MKTSPSNSSLNSASRIPLGRRTPTNIEIQRNNRPSAADISDTVSESAATSKKTGPKKEVTSKIASLWKKVEDTKKKEKFDKKDTKKVWISKGRVIPESDMAYLRPDEAQKKIISDFQKAQESSGGSSSPIKPRSRSRLSIKLSKFKTSSSNPLKKENSFTYTSHKTSTPMTSTSVPSTPHVEEKLDIVNGNTKRHSRVGTFVTPNGQENQHEMNKKAIVQPFNYSPPNAGQAMAALKKNQVVRRNDSYVSSMGRTDPQGSYAKRKKQLQEATKHQEEENDDEDTDGAPTSSVLVTLV